MNLMLTAHCDSTDAFYQSYLAVKPEFAEWCDASRCVFAKVDDNNLVELFFDVNPPKLKAWLKVIAIALRGFAYALPTGLRIRSLSSLSAFGRTRMPKAECLKSRNA